MKNVSASVQYHGEKLTFLDPFFGPPWKTHGGTPSEMVIFTNPHPGVRNVDSRPGQFLHIYLDTQRVHVTPMVMYVYPTGHVVLVDTSDGSWYFFRPRHVHVGTESWHSKTHRPPFSDSMCTGHRLIPSCSSLSHRLTWLFFLRPALQKLFMCGPLWTG